MTLLLAPLLAASLLSGGSGDRVVETTLTIAYETEPAAPREVPGITVNGAIPGPVLRWRVGDTARITVRNRLDDNDASIHWHGLLLPNAMDGVPYLTTPVIPPGEEHVFEFPLRHAGTYWYHSHTGLQEQQGVYGAIVVEPRAGLDALHERIGVDREVVALVSDWTNEDPKEVMRTLMRGSEWYAIRKGNAQSLWGAWRAGRLDEYFDRERRRMHPMDISDVAYDHFLINGRPESRFVDARPGERVLVRVINACASTYVHLTSAAGPLTIVAADGTDVEPVEVKRLLFGNAETYDVVVEMPAGGEAVELRATAHDLSGHASLVLGSTDAPILRATDPPAPEIYGMDEMLRAGLASISERKGLDQATQDRPFAPYSLLRSPEPTAIALAAEERGVREIEMRLTGDMQRYIWGINGKTLAEDPVVRVSSGEVLRIVFINDTMMHHPMHLHGHFFRVVTAAGMRSPLKHTVDVPPMGQRTIEFVADEEPGDWFLHCHILYHMDAGMARVVSYLELGPDHEPRVDPRMIEPVFLMAEGTFLTSMTEGHAMVMKGREDYFVNWHSTYDRDEHDGHVGYDREIDIGWSHYVDANVSTVLGYRFTDVGGTKDRVFAGVRGRLPYMVHTTLTADDEGDARLEFMKSFQLTSRGELHGEWEYDTNTEHEWSASFRWILAKDLDLVAQYHSEHEFGVGITLRY